MKFSIYSAIAVLMAAVMLLSLSAIRSNDSHLQLIEPESTDSSHSPDTQPHRLPAEHEMIQTDDALRPTEETQQSPFCIDNALYIGDSRTIGLMEYAGVPGDFFASIGLSAYNIHKNPLPVPGVGKLTLTQLLTNKTYDIIYLMLGINELGYKLDDAAEQYRLLVDEVHRLQPEACLVLQANLHVSSHKSDAQQYVNNQDIDRFNRKIAELADRKHIFYLDANPLFDDKNMALSPAVTPDGVHLYGNYYVEWGEWIRQQSLEITKE